MLFKLKQMTLYILIALFLIQVIILVVWLIYENNIIDKKIKEFKK